jgi:hypothetical protein
MAKQEQAIITDAAACIERELRKVGCSVPVHLVDDGTAIYIGVPNDNLEVRRRSHAWEVIMNFAPYLQSVSMYAHLEECAHDIALCRPGESATDDLSMARAVGDGPDGADEVVFAPTPEHA